ncbi:hypothetical protein Trydic_g4584 [Trypoxylus dichotomus]
MRSLLVVLATIALAKASVFDDLDWSTVRRREILITQPGFQVTEINERIVGGIEAPRNSIPYQVGLLIQASGSNFFCGGSLISANFVLTAAHCLDGATAVQVRLGAHEINSNTEPTQVRIEGARWIQHPEWDVSLIRNDVALIQLAEPAPISEVIRPVTLPTISQGSNTFAGLSGRISGWGLDSDSATAISPILRQVTTNVIANLLCNIQFLGMIQPSNICTSGAGGVGACSGDSGGPLVVNNVQVGIVSFGLGLGCEIGWPSAFARVTSFSQWIAANSDVPLLP